jgi:replication factor C small subunit
MIYSITSTARPDEIEELLAFSLSGDFEAACTVLFRLLHERGIAPNELINQCYRAIIRRPMDESLRVLLIDQLGITDFRLSEGASSDLQMDALIAQFVMHAKHSGQR